MIKSFAQPWICVISDFLWISDVLLVFEQHRAAAGIRGESNRCITPAVSYWDCEWNGSNSCQIYEISQIDQKYHQTSTLLPLLGEGESRNITAVHRIAHTSPLYRGRHNARLHSAHRILHRLYKEVESADQPTVNCRCTCGILCSVSSSHWSLQQKLLQYYTLSSWCSAQYAVCTLCTVHTQWSMGHGQQPGLSVHRFCKYTWVCSLPQALLQFALRSVKLYRRGCAAGSVLLRLSYLQFALCSYSYRRGCASVLLRLSVWNPCRLTLLT